MAYKQIGALCDGWQLPGAVSDTTKHIYKDASEAGLAKGKSQDALIAGCLFFACRRNNVPRTFREVTELTRVSKKEIGRTFKALEKFIRERDDQRLKSGESTAMVAGGKFTDLLTLHDVHTMLNSMFSRHCRVSRILQPQRTPSRSQRLVQPLLQHA